MVPAKQAPDGRNTYGRDNTMGGYSNVLVVKEDFVLKIPAALEPQVAAPILCAGVTTYSPMKHWKVKAGDKVGIVGFGGLGHLAAKLAKALGAEVTVFTTTREKLEEARRLGIDGVLASDEDALKALKSSFDFMMSTVPEKHDVNPFVALLKRDCTLVVVGALEPMAPVNNQETAFHRKAVAGSLIGSIAETLFDLSKKAVMAWIDDFAPSMGAAIAYYTVFSLAPLLVIVIAMAGAVFGHEAVQGQISASCRGSIGRAGRRHGPGPGRQRQRHRQKGWWPAASASWCC
jgi:D-arabinose 1-dehydrogenase-like Zn-dependent alcohol dehydrogenase